MIDALKSPPSIIAKIGNGIKTVYNTISADFIVLTLIVSNLIKGAQGVGIFESTSNAVKQALATVSAAANGYESIKSTVEAVTLYKERSKLFEYLKKPDTTLSQENRIQILTDACNQIKENRKSLHKTLKVEKKVKLADRANAIIEGIGSRDESTKKEALAKGEKLVEDLRRRINTQFGFALANIVTRVGGLALSIALIVTAANPITLTCSGVLGLGILVVIVGQKIMIPDNPFDEPDKSSKLQTFAYKTRNLAYRVADRIDGFFRPMQLAKS